jgi:hypothetical protein
MFVHVSLSCVGGTLLLDEIPSFKVNLSLSLLKTSLPLFEVSKLTL